MANIDDLILFDAGVGDARALLQARLDANAGGLVTVPNGTYTIGAALGRFWCLNIPAGTILRGESRDGVVFRMAPGVPDGTQLLEVNGPDVTIGSMTLDGNAANQTVSLKQQRHGIRCKGAPRCSVIDVRSHDFTGDGMYFYAGSDDPMVTRSLCDRNQRNGLTMGGGTRGGSFSDSHFIANGAQQFDLEGGLPIDAGTIRGCILDPMDASDDFALTLTGHGSTVRSRAWTVTDCIVNGAALILWIDDVVYARNVGRNMSSKPSLYIYRSCDRILIDRNVLHAAGTPAKDSSMIHVIGTGPGQSAGGVTISNNRLTSERPSYGISAISTRDIAITDNQIIGVPGVRSESGIHIRPAHESTRRAVIARNEIVGFPGYGISLGGNGADMSIDLVSIVDNSFSGGLAAMSLNDGWDSARNVVVSGNVALDGLAMMVHPPAGVDGAIDGSRWVTPPPLASE